ncbi:MAG: hypothetical protein AABX73_01980 [Nanoarchaeota archaeon]
MPADISAIGYLVPIFAYLLVVIVSAAILMKTKMLGESTWWNIFAALLIASIFVSAVGARAYVETIIPWFAVMLIALFLVLMTVGLVGKPVEFMHKGIGIVFVVILGIVFLVSAFFVFSDLIIRYIPGPGYGFNADPKTLFFFDWLYSPRVLGAVLLIVVSALTSWILVKGKK